MGEHGGGLGSQSVLVVPVRRVDADHEEVGVGRSAGVSEVEPNRLAGAGPEPVLDTRRVGGGEVGVVGLGSSQEGEIVDAGAWAGGGALRRAWADVEVDTESSDVSADCCSLSAGDDEVIVRTQPVD